jgi:hypothetical protein
MLCTSIERLRATLLGVGAARRPLSQRGGWEYALRKFEAVSFSRAPALVDQFVGQTGCRYFVSMGALHTTSSSETTTLKVGRNCLGEGALLDRDSPCESPRQAGSRAWRHCLLLSARFHRSDGLLCGRDLSSWFVQLRSAVEDGISDWALAVLMQRAG